MQSVSRLTFAGQLLYWLRQDVVLLLRKHLFQRENVAQDYNVLVGAPYMGKIVGFKWLNIF